MTEYPHVTATTEIGPLDGDGPDVVFVSAETSFGKVTGKVTVYWSDAFEPGEPRLIVEIDGDLPVEVRREGTADTQYNIPEPIDRRVHLSDLVPGAQFRFYDDPDNTSITYMVVGPCETGGINIRPESAKSAGSVFAVDGYRMVYPL